MATRVFDGIKFSEQFLVQWFRRRYLKELFTQHDGRCTTDDKHSIILRAPLKHFVLRTGDLKTYLFEFSITKTPNNGHLWVTVTLTLLPK